MNMTIPEPKEKVFHTLSGKKIKVYLYFEEEDGELRSHCHLLLSGGDRTQDASASLECAKAIGGLEGCDDWQRVPIPNSIINRIEEWAVENGY